MNLAEAASWMITPRGQPVPLERTSITLELDDTVATVVIEQCFRNEGDEPIEAVYTFPLPEGAVLLGLEITLGDRRLNGTVVPVAAAAQAYEDAVSEGDSAVLLESAGGDLQTLNIGNMLPGERAHIRLRCGQILDWSGRHLRYRLPLTIAPRYGHPAQAGWRPHQVPPVDMLIERVAEFRARACGRLARARIRSSSHVITLDHDGGAQVIGTATPLVMDRDLVLEIDAEVPQVSAIRVRDGEHTLVWARFQPSLDQPADPGGRTLVLVVDNSGSMAGDSIARAREALRTVLGGLRPQDRFEIIAFGSRPQPLFGGPVPVHSGTLERAGRFVQSMDAHLGGTELESAMRVAFDACDRSDLPADVILVTDGHVMETSRLVDHARSRGVRVFTVGVALAVAAHVLHELARRTGGACELAAGAESIAVRIERQFQRIHAPVMAAPGIDWPDAPAAVFQVSDAPLFDGDTWHAFAWFDRVPEGEVELAVAPSGALPLRLRGRVRSLPETGLLDGDTMARLAAAARLRSLQLAGDEAAGTELAVRYGLISPWTQFVAVLERAAGEKGSDLPRLSTVPHMLAAGYGGLGLAMSCEVDTDVVHGISERHGRRPTSGDKFAYDVFSESEDAASVADSAKPSEYPGLLPAEVRARLQPLLDAGTWSEEDLVLAWTCVREDAGHVDGLDRHLRRRARAWRRTAPDAEALVEQVGQLLATG